MRNEIAKKKIKAENEEHETEKGSAGRDNFDCLHSVFFLSRFCSSRVIPAACLSLNVFFDFVRPTLSQKCFDAPATKLQNLTNMNDTIKSADNCSWLLLTNIFCRNAKADSTLRSSQVVPQPNINRALD